MKVPASAGDNLLELAQKAGVKIDAPCSGNGVCGKCRLRLIAGTVEHPDNSQHLTREEYEDGWRLACQSRVLGDATLLVPTEAGAFSNERSSLLLGSPALQERLIGDVAATLREKNYYGLDVDFEFVYPAERVLYADFIRTLRERLNPLGCPVLVALAPKTRADQPGLLYGGVT